MNKVAFITGITGQDGSYLAEFLLNKNYHVYGLIRRSSSINTKRIDHIFKNKNLFLNYGDLTDGSCMYMCLSNIKNKYPNMETLEIYNLAAQSHVKISFEMPEYTANSDAFGALKLLEAIRSNNLEKIAKFYQASTSELYGLVQEIPQTETTPFYPRSPYGVAKLYAYWIVKNYRESYGIFACNGILFNHESERRGSTFVTAKIANGLMDYISERKPFYLGNIYARRDWGYAKEFVEAMWLMLQQEKPEDYVIGTGETHSIKEFIDECLKHISPGEYFKWKKDDQNRDILWDIHDDKLVIGIDSKYYRASEVELLLADPSKAKEKLGWEAKTTFKELVEIMMQYVIENGKI